MSVKIHLGHGPLANHLPLVTKRLVFQSDTCHIILLLLGSFLIFPSRSDVEEHNLEPLSASA